MALTTIQFEMEEKEQIKKLAEQHKPKLYPRQYVMLLVEEDAKKKARKAK